MHTALSDEQLLAYNSQGLIPGPTENEAEFAVRAKYCLTLKNHAAPYREELLVDSWVDDPVLCAKAWSTTQMLYGMAPAWVPIAFSNYALKPWHGGCAWIFRLNEAAPIAALLQLRRAFRHQASYLWLYQRDELIAHEATHIGRMAFEEPKFEEFFAYQSSSSAWQRNCGPLFQSANEALCFLLTLGLALALTFLQVLPWLALVLPLCLTAAGLGRLAVRHYQWQRCYKRLLTLVNDSGRARALIYRLTDREIIYFGRLSAPAIYAYASSQEASSVRWRLILLAYLAL